MDRTDIETQIQNRIKALIQDAARPENANILGIDLLTAAYSLAQQICPSPDHAYHQAFKNLATGNTTSIGSEMIGLLTNLSQDLNDGLLGSITDGARAETFDNFLDHGKAYLEKDCEWEAGVIAGSVFEDTVRRICNKNNIPEAGVNMDTLISALDKAGVITPIQAKRARTAAAVRTSAAHARKSELNRSDVKETMVFTRHLLEEKLDG